MLKVYEHIPYFHLYNLPAIRSFPLKEILSGKTEAYLHIKLPSPCTNTTEDGSSADRIYQFEILPCKRTGNCLFQVLYQFLSHVKEEVGNKYELRDACVKSVPDAEDGGAGAGMTLRRKDGHLKHDDADCGSLPDISAAMKRYNFNVTLVKQKDTKKELFQVMSLNGDEDERVTGKARAYILFTEDSDRGHFQLLLPTEDSPVDWIPPGNYTVNDYNVLHKTFTLVPSKKNDDASTESVFVNVVQFWKKLFKRKLPDPVDDLDEVIMQKRIKRECNQSPDVAIRRANLNPQECIYLIQSYADQLSKLRHEFEKEQRQQKSCREIFPGVCKSRVLTIEAVNTAFIRFKPKSWTEFSVANYDTTFIIHRGGNITLRTVSVGDCNIEHENEPFVQSCPFEVPQGIQYALQNDSERKTVILRVFWKCI